MKTAKEYPATHSMSTAWFYADEDGNVAIIVYGDNGPVPENIANTQTCLTEFLFNTFTEPKGSIPVRGLNLTDEQALDFYDQSLKKIESIDLLCSSVVKIKPEKESIFFQEIVAINKEDEVVCLSQKLGLYYVDFIENPSEILLKAIDDIRMVDYYVTDSFDLTDVRQDELNKIPFYVYAQPYSRNIPIVRAIKPELPMKVSQLPQKAQNEIIKIPIKFAETETLQIADYFISDWCMWDDDDFEIFSFDVPNVGQLEFDFYKLSDGKGSCAYYLNCLPLSESESFNFNQCAYYCTVLILTISDCHGIGIDLKKGNFAGMSVFSTNSQCEKIYMAERKSYYMQLSENEKFAMFQKTPIIKVVKFLNPYLLIIDDDAVPIIEKYFPISNHTIEICGQTFPYYLYSEIESHRDEILEYANREYRGVKIPIKLTEDEIKIKLRESETSIH